jgi:hypothetical protein
MSDMQTNPNPKATFVFNTSWLNNAIVADGRKSNRRWFRNPLPFVSASVRNWRRRHQRDENIDMVRSPWIRRPGSNGVFGPPLETGSTISRSELRSGLVASLDGPLGLEQQPVTRDGTPIGLRAAMARAVGVYVLSRVALVLAVFVGVAEAPGRSIVALLSSWDGQHYLSIAAFGYPAHVDVRGYSVTGFFPGYPLLVRIVGSAANVSPLAAGVATSLAAGAFLVALVTCLAARIWDVDVAERAAVMVAIFPGSFVLGLPYPEGTALALATGALLASSRQRWALAGLLAGLATACSPVALALVPALAWEAAVSHRWRAIVAPALAPAGFCAYMGYLWVHTGSLWTWFRVERLGYGHHLDLTAPLGWLHHWPGIGLIELTSMAVLTWGAMALWRQGAPVSWALYAGIVVAAVLFDAGFWVDPRFLLNAFPLVVAIGVGVRGRWYTATVTTFAVLLPLVFLAYTTLGNITAQPWSRDRSFRRVTGRAPTMVRSGRYSDDGSA